MDLGSHYVGDLDSGVKGTEREHKVSKIPEFEEPDFEGYEPSFDQREGRPSRPKDRREPASYPVRSVHNIAWYQPYRAYGARSWGIYFRTPAMLAYCSDVFNVATYNRSDISKADVYNFVWRQVLRHELEHAAHEITIAKAIVDGHIQETDLYSLNLRNINFEGLATHFEFSDYLTSGGTAKIESHGWINIASSSIPVPAPYDQWDGMDVARSERDFNDLLRFNQTENAVQMIRQSIAGKARSKFISIPIFMVDDSSTDPPGGNIWARINAIDCNKVSRALAKDKVRARIHNELEVRIGGNHPQIFSVSGTAMTVPLACHAQAIIHPNFFKQLSDLTGRAKADIQRILRDAT